MIKAGRNVRIVHVAYIYRLPISPIVLQLLLHIFHCLMCEVVVCCLRFDEEVGRLLVNHNSHFHIELPNLSLNPGPWPIMVYLMVEKFFNPATRLPLLGVKG